VGVDQGLDDLVIIFSQIVFYPVKKRPGLLSTDFYPLGLHCAAPDNW
jgi:hypothetical protein